VKANIDALRNHLRNGAELTAEQVRAWLKALDALSTARAKRQRVDALAAAVELDPVKRGRRQRGFRARSKQAAAVIRVRELRAAGMSREKALENVAAEIFCSVAALEKWSSDKKVRSAIEAFEALRPAIEAFGEALRTRKKIG
jgi:uncharacterized protein YoaH (UPF0181 family)